MVGMPWGYVTELHGVWHILTGIGAYTYIALIEFLTWNEPEMVALERGKTVFAWPVSTLLAQTKVEPARKKR